MFVKLYCRGMTQKAQLGHKAQLYIKYLREMCSCPETVCQITALKECPPAEQTSSVKSDCNWYQQTNNASDYEKYRDFVTSFWTIWCEYTLYTTALS